MRHWQQGVSFSRNRKSRRDEQLRRLEAMRSARARKRLEGPAPDPEPKLERWYRFEIGVRDKLTGATSYGEAWTDFRSIRDAARRLKVVKEYCL